MSDLSEIIESYSGFEKAVQRAIREFCRPWCPSCKGGCCDADICRETLESPFLSLIYRTYSPRSRFSETGGWLTDTGCALAVGRAPVCYEYLCSRITGAELSHTARYLLTVLFRLVTHTGRFASGRKHVVELTDPEALQMLDLSRFKKRLKESEEALDIVLNFQHKNRISANARSGLAKIVKPPDFPAV